MLRQFCHALEFLPTEFSFDSNEAVPACFRDFERWTKRGRDRGGEI